MHNPIQFYLYSTLNNRHCRKATWQKSGWTFRPLTSKPEETMESKNIPEMEMKKKPREDPDIFWGTSYSDIYKVLCVCKDDNPDTFPILGLKIKNRIPQQMPEQTLLFSILFFYFDLKSNIHLGELYEPLLTSIWTHDAPAIWINPPFFFFCVLIICSSCCLWESLQELFDPADSCVYVSLLISLSFSWFVPPVITNRTFCVVMLNKCIFYKDTRKDSEIKSL